MATDNIHNIDKSFMMAHFHKVRTTGMHVTRDNFAPIYCLTALCRTLVKLDIGHPFSQHLLKYIMYYFWPSNALFEMAQEEYRDGFI